MIKRVTLTLFKGDFEQGFPALLRIESTKTQVTGKLPPCDKILDLYEKWRLDYYQMVLPQARIKAKPNQITYISRRSSGNDLANHLNKWLNSGECEEWRKIRDGLLQNLSKEEEIHLIIQTEDIRLRRLPWHAWNLFSEYYTQAEIALGSTEYQPPQNSYVPLTEKVRILAILGDSTGIDLLKDKDLLEQLPHAEPKFLPQPEREQLNEDLWDQPWQILFFAGHSASQTDGKTGQLYINSTDILELDDLREALRKAVEQGLQLAIFNSCDGLGLAQELADLYIPQIIVMREPVPDQIAQKFLQYFLKSFSLGNSLYSAVREARLKLRILEKDFPFASWLPVICQNPAVEKLPTWNGLYNSTGVVGDCSTPLPPPPKPDSKFSQPQQRLKLPTVLGISLAVSCLVIGVRSHGKLESLELWAYDCFLQLQPPPSAPDNRILVVAVNDDDIRQFKKPLTDRTIDQLLTKLEKYQPRVIGLDIERSEPTYTKADWENLGQHIQNSNLSIIPVCVVGEVNGQYQPLLAKAPPPGVSSERLGFSDGLIPDPDDTIRRYSLVMDLRPESPCSTQYSFAFQLVKNFLSPHTQYRYYTGKKLQINSTVLQSLQPDFGGYQRTKRDVAGYQILIKYYSNLVSQEVTLTEIMHGTDSDLRLLIQNRIVLIGYVNSKTKDIHPTPVGKMYGVRIHAQVASQLLDIVNGSPPLSSWSKMGDNFWIFCWSIIGGILAWSFRSLQGLSVSIVVGLLVLFGICSCFTNAVWIPFVPAVVSLLITSYLIYYMNKIEMKIVIAAFKKGKFTKR